MEPDWVWLGTRVRAARAARTPKLSQDDLADALGLGRSTVQNIERGKAYKNLTPAHRKIAKFFGWGSVEAVLAGAEPETENETGPTSLPLRIAQAIADEGPVLDTAIIPLPGIEEPDGQIVVVVKGRSTASPEEIRKAIESWERAQDRLREAAQEPPKVNEA